MDLFLSVILCLLSGTTLNSLLHFDRDGSMTRLEVRIVGRLDRERALVERALERIEVGVLGQRARRGRSPGGPEGSPPPPWPLIPQRRRGEGQRVRSAAHPDQPGGALLYDLVGILAG